MNGVAEVGYWGSVSLTVTWLAFDNTSSLPISSGTMDVRDTEGKWGGWELRVRYDEPSGGGNITIAGRPEFPIPGNAALVLYYYTAHFNTYDMGVGDGTATSGWVARLYDPQPPPPPPGGGA